MNSAVALHFFLARLLLNCLLHRTSTDSEKITDRRTYLQAFQETMSKKAAKKRPKNQRKRQSQAQALLFAECAKTGQVQKPPRDIHLPIHHLGLKPSAFTKVRYRAAEHRGRWLFLRRALSDQWTQYLASTFLEKTKDTLFGQHSKWLTANGHPK